ncbi:VOC family protein [Nocardia sp. NPDC046473]|uniref:VOC family protein n=1 Tax=Nocardia sp. NPDC046473 TaxID=3155733 RepID=UPI003402A506
MLTSNVTEHVPAGYATVTPWIGGPDTGALMDFLTEAFEAQELARIVNADGSIGHAEARIGDSVVMAFDSRPGWPVTPSMIRLFVADADAVYERALTAGAISVTAVTELFFGDRVGRVRDPFGNIWWIQAHVKDIPAEQFPAAASDPGAIEAMTYLQTSLDAELRGRSR